MSAWMVNSALAVLFLAATTGLFFFVVTRGALLVHGLSPGQAGEKSHVYPIYSNMWLIKLVDFQPIISAILLFQYNRPGEPERLEHLCTGFVVVRAGEPARSFFRRAREVVERFDTPGMGDQRGCVRVLADDPGAVRWALLPERYWVPHRNGQSGKLCASLARLIDHLLQPQLPWRKLLARYFILAARDDFCYLRTSRREGTAILPSLRSAQVSVVVAVDTSGSIKPEEMNDFFSEVGALRAQGRARVALLACDERLASGAPWLFEPWEDLRPPESVGGGGGTDFRPVFDWVARPQDHRPDLLVYFTDAEGEFPAVEPSYPVLWHVKGKEAVPWGQRIQLN